MPLSCSTNSKCFSVHWEIKSRLLTMVCKVSHHLVPDHLFNLICYQSLLHSTALVSPGSLLFFTVRMHHLLSGPLHLWCLLPEHPPRCQHGLLPHFNQGSAQVPPQKWNSLQITPSLQEPLFLFLSLVFFIALSLSDTMSRGGEWRGGAGHQDSLKFPRWLQPRLTISGLKGKS